MTRLRVLTWHVHGNYLWYLSSIPHDIFLPVRAGAPEGYGGRGASFTWPDNVYEVPADEVRDLDVDVVITQSHRNWLEDRPAILSPAQLDLPHVHIEHDPPRASPTDTRHPIDDPSVLIVHVTPFNRLMWDSGRSRTRVIEHGVTVPESARYTGELERGLVVVNGLAQRGRRLGADVYEEVRRSVPLDLVGMQSEAAGGLGEVPPTGLAAFEARYRFFFNPIRWTSLGLAVRGDDGRAPDRRPGHDGDGHGGGERRVRVRGHRRRPPRPAHARAVARPGPGPRAGRGGEEDGAAAVLDRPVRRRLARHPPRGGSAGSRDHGAHELVDPGHVVRPVGVEGLGVGDAG